MTVGTTNKSWTNLPSIGVPHILDKQNHSAILVTANNQGKHLLSQPADQTIAMCKNSQYWQLDENHCSPPVQYKTRGEKWVPFGIIKNKSME